MKLLRTIRLDSSDAFVFERAAAPGEWAVSGAFAFPSLDIAALQGKARAAFRAGFLGLSSLGRSTLVQIVDATEQDRAAAVELLARQLAERFGAPDLGSACAAAEEEISFSASLCHHAAGVVVAVTRTVEGGSIREAYCSLLPSAQFTPRPFNLVDVVGEATGKEKHLHLAEAAKGEST